MRTIEKKNEDTFIGCVLKLSRGMLDRLSIVEE